MAQNELSFLVHNVSSISVHCNGKRPAYPELRSRSLDLCKASVKSHVLITTNMNRGDIASDSPKNPPPPETVRSLSTRRGSKMKQHVRVKSKKDIRKFKHDAFVLNCNQSLCPALAERLRRHRCADSRRRTDGPSHVKQEKGINVSPTLSKLYHATPVSSTDAKVVQTEITLNDFILQNEAAHTLAYINEGPFKITDTKGTPKRDIYKKLLHTEITNWLQTVPIFYSTEFTAKYLKENIVTVFVERIARLYALQSFKDNYSTKVKSEIDHCLNILPMWLPNNEQNQILFKNSLRNKLFNKITELNEDFLKNDGKEQNVLEKVISKESQGKELFIRDSLYAKVVSNWLSRTKLNATVPKKQLVTSILDKVRPLLNTFLQEKGSKRTLKRKIVEDLDGLSISAFNSKNISVEINRLADELVHRLLTIQSKLDSYPKLQFENMTAHTPTVYNSKLKMIVHDAVVKALGKVNLNRIRDIENEVCNVILNYVEALHAGIGNSISTEICNVLCKKSSISEEKAMQVAKKLKLQIRIALKCNKTISKASGHSIKSQKSDVTTIYRSSESGPVTSTPKKQNKKNIPKLNKEERSYMKNVAKLIGAWMETLPKKFDDDKQYKEVIINDLAGDIMDEVKREQMSPEIETDKYKHINYMIYRWLSRFEVFGDLHDGIPLIENFMEKLREIPEPKLTTPQHGTRQTMGNLRHYEKDIGWEQEYVPKGIDILEDQISVWLNEQPTTMRDDKHQRHAMIKDLAVKLQEHKKNKSPEDVINMDIRQWLSKVVKPEEKEHIGLLTQYLKERVMNVPQDETLEAINQKRLMQKAERRQNASLAISQTEDEVDAIDPEQTMKEYILKYIERNYDIDDPLAKGAFGQLLKTELRKLSPDVRNEVYNDLANNEHFKPEDFKNGLDYIRMISDWLKNIPVNALYNTPGNRPRVDFVLDLAKNIQEVEQQRKENSEEMDYDLFLSSIISISLRTYNVPILIEHKDDIPLMINQLLSKIIANRSVIRQDDFVPNNEMTEQNFYDFIDQYIRVNGKEIGNDEIKLKVWTARLAKEIKKLLEHVDNPSALTKAQIYDQFSKVPIPRQESVERFTLENKYIDDITDWLKNLPLLPITGIPAAEKQRADMISDLAGKLSEREANKRSDSPAINADQNKDLIEYINNWISQLPLHPNKNILVPVVIQQLLNRIEKTNEKEAEEKIKEIINREGTGEIIHNIPQKDCTELTVPAADIIISDGKDSKSPETHIVESIENWCNKLPIEGVDKDVVNSLRNNIAKQLYQKIGEFNVNPRIYNDDVLYENLLGDEIDTQLENLPQNSKLQNNSKILKDGLLNTILTMKKIINEKAAGDTYKHKLETTIDAAIPNPIQDRQLIEPEFEIYKKHLASMFILDNFDHTDDEIKIKYEKRIRDIIDKYFESAQKRNALPVTRAQMYNDLYSELFKVPMPNEESVIDEVEEVKTRCEIDAWFENLPLREANGISEYVEWDQILSMLAKRLHHIEKSEPNPDEKMYKEISKWLQRLPLIAEEESNTDYYTSSLQNALKTSVEARKYVPAESHDLTREKSIGKQKPHKGLHTSQVAGPSRSGDKPRSKTCEQMTYTTHKRPGALIVEIVENWCDEIPLIGDQIQNKMIKGDLSTKIVIKICELNMDPNIFNDDLVYNQLLNEEIDKQISELSTDEDFQTNKLERKQVLIGMIKSIKELIREENQKYEYKTELRSTVSSILKNHSDTPDKTAEFNKLKDNIVHDFVLFYYNKDDDETKLIYKKNLQNAVSTYLSETEDFNEHPDPLVKLNQLICEMSKVPAPKNKVLKNEVEEIKMKQEIEQFFEKNSLNDDTDKTQQIKTTLAKILNEIEKSGHSDNTDKLMNVETAKCLNKYNTEVNPDAIEKFVNTLKNNESERKAPPRAKDDDALNSSGSQRPEDTCLPPKTGPHYTSEIHNADFHAQTQGQIPQNIGIPLMDQSQCQCGQKWMPSNQTPEPGLAEVGQASPKVFHLPPFGQNQHLIGTSLPTSSVTPQLSSSYCPRNTERRSGLVFPGNDFDHSQGPINYNEFKSKTFLNSTMVPQEVDISGEINAIAPMEPYKGLRPYSSSIDQGSNKSSFSKMTTPRRVQGEASTREPVDLTADQLFTAPIFMPRPKSSHLTVLSGNPSGSSRCFRPSRVPSGRSSNRYWPATVQKEKYPCICDKKIKMKGRPFYIVPVDEYCEDCGGFSSTWYKMPMPRCFYMQY